MNLVTCTRRNLCAPLTPLHVPGRCFAHPFPRALSYCLYVPLLLILRPKEFCLVFASLVTTTLVVGQSRRSSFPSIVIYCELYCIFFIIQFSVVIATELSNKIVSKFSRQHI
jgi:hypothetical protein